MGVGGGADISWEEEEKKERTKNEEIKIKIKMKVSFKKSASSHEPIQQTRHQRLHFDHIVLSLFTRYTYTNHQPNNTTKNTNNPNMKPSTILKRKQKKEAPGNLVMLPGGRKSVV